MTIQPKISRRQTLSGLAVGTLGILFSPISLAQSSFFQRYPWLNVLWKKEGFNKGELEKLLGKLKPSKKVKGLMSRQAEATPYHKYRKLFVTKSMVKRSKAKLKTYRSLFNRVEKAYQVPAEVVVTLWGMESRYGSYKGRHSVLQALFTLATGKGRRAKFFQNEMLEFLRLSRDEGWNPAKIKGSYAGAMGQVQMIPSTLRNYAVDFDGDGKRDVFNNRVDSMASIANYLHHYGWEMGAPYSYPVKYHKGLEKLVVDSSKDRRPGSEWIGAGIRLKNGKKPPANREAALIKLESSKGDVYHLVYKNFWVITRWNRSNRFAMVVGELSQRLSGVT